MNTARQVAWPYSQPRSQQKQLFTNFLIASLFWYTETIPLLELVTSCSVCSGRERGTVFFNRFCFYQTYGMTRGGVLLTESFPVAPGLSNTLWLSRFAIATSLVREQLHKYIFFQRKLLKLQHGFWSCSAAVRTTSTTEPQAVRNRPPHFSREHSLRILQFECTNSRA